MSSGHDYLRRDPDIGPLVDTYGILELEPAPDLFERLVVSIVNQQVSTEAARAIRTRLFEAVDVTPQGLLTADRATLKSAGLSRQKISTVREAAGWFHEEAITREWFEGMDDAAVIDELTRISGIGPWTAKVTLLFGLGREDVFPVEDLAIRRGMTDRFGDETRSEMRDRAENWRPYRSIASLYIWQYYVDENSTVDDIVA